MTLLGGCVFSFTQIGGHCMRGWVEASLHTVEAWKTFGD